MLRRLWVERVLILEGLLLAEIVEILAKGAYFLFVLLANFAVLSFEFVEGLADDVEFVDLARDWGGRGKSG